MPSIQRLFSSRRSMVILCAASVAAVVLSATVWRMYLSKPIASHPIRTVHMPFRLATKEPASVGICYVRGFSLGTSEPDRVIVGIWEDGTVAWGEDAVSGSGTCLIGKVPPERVARLIDSLLNLDVFAANYRGGYRMPVDSSYVTISVRGRGRCASIASAHELFEQNPNLVATHRGIEVRGSQTPMAALAEVAADYRSMMDYRLFRTEWEQARQLIAGFRPEPAEPMQRPDLIVATVRGE